MDPSAIMAAYNGLKTAKDIFTGFSDLKIEAASLAKINEAAKLVGEAQDTLFQLREDLLRLQTENETIRKKLDRSEEWGKKVAKYKLVKTSGGAVVYESTDDPKHFACPSCIEKENIQILQDNRTISGKYRCVSCAAEYPINPRKNVKII